MLIWVLPKKRFDGRQVYLWTESRLCFDNTAACQVGVSIFLVTRFWDTQKLLDFKEWEGTNGFVNFPRSISLIFPHLSPSDRQYSSRNYILKWSVIQPIVLGTGYLINKTRSIIGHNQWCRSKGCFVRRAVPCRAVPCRAVPCRAVPCRAVPKEIWFDLSTTTGTSRFQAQP